MKFSLTALCAFLFLASFSQKMYWRADVTTGEYGLMKTNFFLQQKNNFIVGSTSPNAHKRIIGGLKASFAKSMFQTDGSLMELDSIVVNNDEISGYLVLEKKKYYLKGIKQGNSIKAALLGRSSGKVYGKIEATEVNVLQKPKDYAMLWKDIKDLTERYIYNKTSLQSKEWINFCEEMQDFAAIAEDDAEFAYGFFYKAKELPFTHYAVTGNKDSAVNYAIAGFNSSEAEIRPSLTMLTRQTLLLDVPAFNFRVKDIDTLMNQIVSSGAENLIIDLRRNTGGDMEGGMRICQYLTNKTLYGGVMLSQVYWNSHTAAPQIEEYKNFKRMNNANYAWFKNEVKNGVEGLCLVTEPLSNTFKGKILILTSKSTASASEPFVYTLQKENIATVIGEKTAGAVISMEYFYLQNLALTIPMLDYYTYDGKRLDKIGVEPNIKCDPKEALDVALRKIDGK